MSTYAYFDRVLEKYVLCGDNARFCNHSTAPNSGDDPTNANATMAICDILPGEEIVCDYYSFDVNASSKLMAADR